MERELVIVLEHHLFDVLAVEDAVRAVGLGVIDSGDEFLLAALHPHIVGVLQRKADNLGLTGRKHGSYFSSSLASRFVHVEADHDLLVGGEPLVCLLDVVPCTLCARHQRHHWIAVAECLAHGKAVHLALCDDHLLAAIAEEMLTEEECGGLIAKPRERLVLGTYMLSHDGAFSVTVVGDLHGLTGQFTDGVVVLLTRSLTELALSERLVVAGWDQVLHSSLLFDFDIAVSLLAVTAAKAPAMPI